MPISEHAREPARQETVQVSRMNLIWPATIVLAAVIMFIWFWQTTPAMALAMAMLPLLGGGTALTAVYGTSWIAQLRHLIGAKGR